MIFIIGSRDKKRTRLFVCTTKLHFRIEFRIKIIKPMTLLLPLIIK